MRSRKTVHVSTKGSNICRLVMLETNWQIMTWCNLYVNLLHSARHKEDYFTRRDAGHFPTSSPKKRPRTEEPNHQNWILDLKINQGQYSLCVAPKIITIRFHMESFSVNSIEFCKPQNWKIMQHLISKFTNLWNTCH